MALPTQVLRAARRGFGLPRGHVRVLSTRFGKVCLAHRAADGTHTQMRLVRRTADSDERLTSETQWLQHLSRMHRLRVPQPLRWTDGALVSPELSDRDGGRWRAVACTWVPGAHLRGGLRRVHFERAGALVAHLHRASADAPAAIAAARPTWWIPRLCQLSPELGSLLAGTAVPSALATTLADELRDAAVALQRAHDALPTDAAHVGLIHTDTHWNNLRSDRGRIGLVDFEDFATGRFMLDVACLYEDVEQRRDGSRVLDAILTGYDRATSLPAHYRRDLQVMLAFRRLDYVGWVLSWPQPDLRSWGPALLRTAPGYIHDRLAD